MKNIWKLYKKTENFKKSYLSWLLIEKMVQISVFCRIFECFCDAVDFPERYRDKQINESYAGDNFYSFPL